MSGGSRGSIFSSFSKRFSKSSTPSKSSNKHSKNVPKNNTRIEIVKSGIHLGPNLVTHEEETISYANLLKSGPGKIKTLEAAEDFLRRYYAY